MLRAWLNFLFFFPVVLMGIITVQFWPEFQRISVDRLSQFFNRPGIHVTGVRGDPLEGFFIQKLEVRLPIASFVVEELSLVPGSWIQNLKNHSLIFERIEAKRVPTQFHSLLGLPEKHLTEVSHFFDTVGAKTILLRSLEIEMPLTREKISIPEVLIENWVTQRDRFSFSEFTVSSPYFNFQVTDLGTRIQGEFKAGENSALIKPIPVRLKVHPLPGRRAMIWSLFDGQWSGEYDPFQKFEFKAAQWSAREWFKDTPPIEAAEMSLDVHAEDFGGRIQMGSILMAILSDAVDLRTQFRLGSVLYQNEAIQIHGVGPKAKMLKKLAQAAEGHFKPSSFVFRAANGRHHEVLRLLPKVFGKKTSTMFELISPSSRSLEDALSWILYQKSEVDLSPEQEQALAETANYFSYKGVQLGFKVPELELEREPAAEDTDKPKADEPEPSEDD